MKISKRLQTLDAMVNGHYDHIWDCCCDHGHLGMTLLNRKAGEHIHFVDIVPSIMSELAANLERLFQKNNRNSQWHVHCIDVVDLPIANYGVAQKHLLIIAGIGGEQTIAMVERLLARFAGQQIDFLLCPLRHQFKLRSGLKALNLGLIDECLIKENKWYYEVIHVSTSHCGAISTVGSMMWLNAGERGRVYLNQTLAHYQRMVNRSGQDVRAIIEAYIELKAELEF